MCFQSQILWMWGRCNSPLIYNSSLVWYICTWRPPAAELRGQAWQQLTSCGRFCTASLTMIDRQRWRRRSRWDKYCSGLLLRGNFEPQGVQISNRLMACEWPLCITFLQCDQRARRGLFTRDSLCYPVIFISYIRVLRTETKCSTSESQGTGDFSGVVSPEKQIIPADYSFWPFQLTSWISWGHRTVRHKSH